MKAQVKTPILIAVVVVLVGGVVYWGMKSIGEAGGLDHGQVQYTPGKPPWMETDPNKKGPGNGPPTSAPGAPAAPGAQTGAPIQPGMPVGPPVLGNGGK